MFFLKMIYFIYTSFSQHAAALDPNSLYPLTAVMFLLHSYKQLLRHDWNIHFSAPIILLFM